MTSTLLLAALMLSGGSSAMPDCPLAVPAGTTLQGRVVSSAAMARGVTTLVLRRELPEAAETCEVPVDPVGGFVLDGLPAGVYSLRMAGREVGALFASPGGGAVELSVYLDRENRLLGCLDAPACAEWLRPVLRWPPAAGADVDPGIELLALRLGMAIAMRLSEPPEVFCLSRPEAAIEALRRVHDAVVPRAECEPAREMLLPPPPAAGEPWPRPPFDRRLRHGERRAVEISSWLRPDRDGELRVTVLTHLSGGVTYHCELDRMDTDWIPRTCWAGFDI